MNHLSMLWSSFNQFLNQNEGADYVVTGSAIIGGYTIHFAQFDSLLKTSLTMLSIIFVAYRIYSHHQDRIALKKDKNSKRVDAE